MQPNTNLRAVSDSQLIEALSTLANECFTSLIIVNALAGCSTESWEIIRGTKPTDLLLEAQSRGIDLHKIRGNVDDSRLVDATWTEGLIAAPFSYNDYLKSSQPHAEENTMNMPHS
ncbi:hypothetical protein RYA05_00280 [Pseudomonas syringae pv. actinidiae]|mgnify:CR=1 FL=1|nr:hypothetical protein [Pseudomonas syringae pv. actinidiae]